MVLVETHRQPSYRMPAGGAHILADRVVGRNKQLLQRRPSGGRSNGSPPPLNHGMMGHSMRDMNSYYTLGGARGDREPQRSTSARSPVLHSTVITNQGGMRHNHSAPDRSLYHVASTSQPPSYAPPMSMKTTRESPLMHRHRVVNGGAPTGTYRPPHSPKAIGKIQTQRPPPVLWSTGTLSSGCAAGLE